MHDRRSFLASLGALGALGALAAGCAVGGPFRRGRPRALGAAGIQLYTVRRLMAKDVPGTLAALAGIGYREVEFAGYHGHAARAIRSWLDAAGLRAPSVHVPLEDLAANWTRVLDDAGVVGHRWITLPWLGNADRTPEAMKWIAALLNARGRDAARRGIRVAYHNHDFELRGRPDLLEILLRETDPACVDFELDVYWAVRAGRDPVRLIRRHPGRFRLLHLKDAAGDAARTMVDVGAGTIDFAAVLAAASADGALAHAFVEHDNPADPLRSASTSYRNLAALLNRAAP